jgi:riboflavin-specific deaminase-like protein
MDHVRSDEEPHRSLDGIRRADALFVGVAWLIELVFQSFRNGIIEDQAGKEQHIPDRPYTLLSCGMSIDGYLGSAAPRRLELSNAADFDRVDSVRASCDAILVGAATVRIDNPRLLVRSQGRREARTACGLPPSPTKVTVTERVELDPRADFFTTGEIEKFVYCASRRVVDARSRLGEVATVVDGGERVKMRRLTEDLGERGVRRLMVEGGGTVHTQFLTDNLVDELQLVVAPLFVGDSRAPRFVRDGRFPWNPTRRAELAEVRQIGDVVLLRYALSTRFQAD